MSDLSFYFIEYAALGSIESHKSGSCFFMQHFTQCTMWTRRRSGMDPVTSWLKDNQLNSRGTCNTVWQQRSNFKPANLPAPKREIPVLCWHVFFLVALPYVWALVNYNLSDDVFVKLMTNWDFLFFSMLPLLTCFLGGSWDERSQGRERPKGN